ERVDDRRQYESLWCSVEQISPHSFAFWREAAGWTRFGHAGKLHLKRVEDPAIFTPHGRWSINVTHCILSRSSCVPPPPCLYDFRGQTWPVDCSVVRRETATMLRDTGGQMLCFFSV
ncbi:unnamed protein product, partial [Hapterophycus canaliculatus]